MKRGLLIIAALALISALAISYFDREWEPGLIEITEDIRAEACRGRVEGFNSYIDRGAVEESLKKATLERMRKDFIYNSERSPDRYVRVRNIIENVIPNLLHLKWQLLEEQVRAGELGPICNMEIVRLKDRGSIVKLKFPGGERSAWGFGKVDGQWRLVSIYDIMPLTVASLESGNKRVFNQKFRRQRARIDEKHNVPEANNNDGREPSDSNGDTGDLRVEEKVETPHHEEVHEGDVRVEDESSIETASIVTEVREDTDGLPEKAGGYDFRNTRWGMTPDQVAASEGSEPEKGGGGELVFDTWYKGESVKVRYKFTENKLKAGGIIFLTEHPDELFYVQDFMRLRDDFTAQYGEPAIDEEIWYNRLYEDKPERMGFAVSIGHLKLRTKWRIVDSDILLELKSDNYEIALVLSYHSR